MRHTCRSLHKCQLCVNEGTYCNPSGCVPFARAAQASDFGRNSAASAELNCLKELHCLIHVFGRHIQDPLQCQVQCVEWQLSSVHAVVLACIHLRQDGLVIATAVMQNKGYIPSSKVHKSCCRAAGQSIRCCHAHSKSCRHISLQNT